MKSAVRRLYFLRGNYEINSQRLLKNMYDLITINPPRIKVDETRRPQQLVHR